MNNDSQSEHDQPESGYDPHSPEFSSADWKIMSFYASLGIVPLIAILVVSYFLYTRNPNFNNFPDPPKLPQLIEAGSVLK